MPWFDMALHKSLGQRASRLVDSMICFRKPSESMTGSYLTIRKLDHVVSVKLVCQ
jgi:hypothetical protein